MTGYIPDLLSAARPRLCDGSRKLLEQHADMLASFGGEDDDDKAIADAIRFLLEKEENLKVALDRNDKESV